MKKIILSALLLCAAASGAMAQKALPVDENVRIGHLENGLTYYIRHNETPKQRCEFHIAQAVGATLEEDNQNGLAHFLEHMCFNGTEHFEGKGIITYFESIGVNFGGNINAYTSLDKTVYRLSDVPTVREGIIDSALLVMHDWSCAVSLLPEEIDAERGVIREEWRTGRTASRRMYSASQAAMFPGSKYAIRDVIGDTAVINNFTYDALRDYYHKWYGPDLQAIIVVGDIDVDQIEAKIKALWANVPARENRGERPIAEVPDNEKPNVSFVQDAEAQQSIITLLYKHDPIPAEFKATDLVYVQDICDELIYAIMDERLSEITTKPTSPITGGVMAYTDLFPAKDAFYNRVIAKEGREKEAMMLLMEQVEKMRRYGFTDDEVERAKTNYLTGVEQSYNERQNCKNIVYTQQYINNFLKHTPIPGIEWEMETVKAVMPMINATVLKQVADRYISENNIVFNIQAPQKESIVLPAEDEVLAALTGMKDLEIEAPKVAQVDGNLVKKAPKAGKIKKTKYIESLGVTEWTLKNGVRVAIKPTEFKQDEIQMFAYSLGGMTLVEQEDLMSAELATTLVDRMGLSTFSMQDLQKALTGKNVGVQAGINPHTEEVSGYSSVKDFETMLQLIYLGFTAPRRDEEMYNTVMGLLENSLKNKSTNPKSLFQDSVAMMRSDYNPRTMVLNDETLKQIDLDRVMAVYSERFANPADFTFIFVGNIDPKNKETQKLICTYLGGMKTQKSRESFKDLGIRAPKGVAKNYFTQDMQTRTATNYIQYTSYDIPFSLKNNLTATLIGNILGTRYLESIREREGGSYGVGCQAYQTAYPVDGTYLYMRFDTDPEKHVRLMEIIHEEVNTIIENGPLATDLQKEKESMLKDFQENKEKNGWWVDAIESYLKLGINRYADFEATVNSITAEDVQAMLKRLAASGNMFEVVMLPK